MLVFVCYTSGPQTFWHRGLVSWKTVFPRTGGGGGEDGSGGNASNGSGGNASSGECWGAAGEASLARPPLTSFCTGQWPGCWGPLCYTTSVATTELCCCSMKASECAWLCSNEILFPKTGGGRFGPRTIVC